jgi:hypothetical protein
MHPVLSLDLARGSQWMLELDLAPWHPAAIVHLMEVISMATASPQANVLELLMIMMIAVPTKFRRKRLHVIFIH